MEAPKTKGLPPLRAAAAVSMGITMLDYHSRIRKKELVKNAILEATVMKPNSLLPPDVK